MNSKTAYGSRGWKRSVLIVDDEEINRVLLSEALKKDYDIIPAADGQEALKRMEECGDGLSLVLLDLIMPNLSGQDVLRQIKAQPAYQDIPVIVASGDFSQEIDCLNAGASDFIQKPYPEPGVVLARVRRAIELFESRQIIQSTERDPLTGLLNKEFFYSYAEQYDQHHRDVPMDAIVLDINNFSTLNERYGMAYADEVLRKVSQAARSMVNASGGIVCRRESDVFQVYCPHREDYKAILDSAANGLSVEQNDNNRVRLRMGVYSCVDKSLDMERRFDRAKMAADTVRNSFTRSIGLYDDTLHKSELYAEQLIEDFPRAIEERQFRVYYQPKFDIRKQTPILSSAEALVRWNHPELGMISPGVFIPLFEENGLIHELDQYVWREAARQIREWKDRFGFSIPVSVNVSRVNMFDPDIVNVLLGILRENELTSVDLLLEVTESAYAEDADQIIERVHQLRDAGFLIEMDDFGAGYSSLNMLSTMPIDVLKLDMKFVQTTLAEEKNVHILQMIMEIANHISAPVIAEGVETEEQLNILKDINCDYVQGYYFSPPVPPAKFERFLEERKKQIEETESKGRTEEKQAAPVQKERFSIGKKLSEHLSIPTRKASIFFLAVAILLTVALFIADSMTISGYQSMAKATERYILARQSAADLEAASDDLTKNVRLFVMTGELEYLENYFEEADVTRRRDRAVSDLESLMTDRQAMAYRYLSDAMSYSNELMGLEYLAMNYILSTGDYDPARIPEILRAQGLTEEQRAYTAEEKKAKAQELVFGKDYMGYKEKIKANAALCTQELIEVTNQARLQTDRRMSSLMTLQHFLMGVQLVVNLLIVFFIIVWIRRPLILMVEHMKDKQFVPETGAEELRFVAATYNAVFEESMQTHERLKYGSMHDALTGVYNRSAYDYMRSDLNMSENALLLVDVDKLKTVNDTYGHDVGDLVLKNVAEILKYSFRATDMVFRLGGDEFVVIMVDVDSSLRDMVIRKIEQANVMLQKPRGDLPPVSISVGVAFGDRDNPGGDIFKDADTALYRMKKEGRRGCIVY